MYTCKTDDGQERPMTRREIRGRLLQEARKLPIRSDDRDWRLRAAFTYGQALRGVPAKDWK